MTLKPMEKPLMDTLRADMRLAIAQNSSDDVEILSAVIARIEELEQELFKIATEHPYVKTRNRALAMTRKQVLL